MQMINQIVLAGPSQLQLLLQFKFEWLTCKEGKMAHSANHSVF